jgi:hypothetical protein
MPFLTLKRSNDHWLLHGPNDEPFFSLGINDVDESNLLHPHNESRPGVVFVSKIVTWLQSFYLKTLE